MNYLPCSKIPREFKPSLEEIKGWIIEDVWVDKYDGWEPHIQAIKHENGDISLRFCAYLKREGKSIWSPYTFCFYDWTINDLKEEINKCNADIIKMLLKKFFE